MAYWVDRIKKGEKVIYNRTLAEAEKQLAAAYKTAAANIVVEINDLYRKLDVADDILLVNDLYRNNQYFYLLNQFNQILNQLGESEVKITEAKLLEMYAKTSSLVGDSAPFRVAASPIDLGTEVINSIWCKDGRLWSDRIWTSKSKMQSSLQQGLIECVSRGLPKDKVIEGLEVITNSNFNNADRLVRTELTYVQNKAAADRYEAAGIEYYQYLAEDDERSDDECLALNGEVFRFDEAIVGENFPPIHANCRCTILPVVK